MTPVRNLYGDGMPITERWCKECVWLKAGYL
jgi:hypothetical protein